jgi:hypothetical protein
MFASHNSSKQGPTTSHLKPKANAIVSSTARIGFGLPLVTTQHINIMNKEIAAASVSQVDHNSISTDWNVDNDGDEDDDSDDVVLQDLADACTWLLNKYVHSEALSLLRKVNIDMPSTICLLGSPTVTYTVDKNTICLRLRDVNGIRYHVSMLLRVCMHELAHVCSSSWNAHDEAFQIIEAKLLELWAKGPGHDDVSRWKIPCSYIN